MTDEIPVFPAGDMPPLVLRDQRPRHVRVMFALSRWTGGRTILWRWRDETPRKRLVIRLEERPWSPAKTWVEGEQVLDAKILNTYIRDNQ